MTLWTKWRLSVLWSEADREISRVRRLLSDHPFWFRPASRADIESAVSRMELASRYEKVPRVLDADLRAFRDAVDRHLPLLRTSRFRRMVVMALFSAALIVCAGYLVLKTPV